jgi:hypothetical protein
MRCLLRCPLQAQHRAITLSITTSAGAALACAANPHEVVTGAVTFTGCSIILKTGTYKLTTASSEPFRG